MRGLRGDMIARGYGRVAAGKAEGAGAEATATGDQALAGPGTPVADKICAQKRIL